MTGSILITSNQNFIQAFRESVLPLPLRHQKFVLSKSKMMTHEYVLSGMTCSHCTATVKEKLMEVQGITKADITLDPPRAILTMDRHIEIGELQNAIGNNSKYRISELTIAPPAMQQLGEEDRSFWMTYKPVLLIFVFITGLTLLSEATAGEFHWMRWMNMFMAGFFLVFSFFKLMDLRSFASSYASYDVIARRWFAWGYIYPFVEVALGLMFFLNADILLTNFLTFFVMSISSIGVIQSLLKKRRIRCACLGAVFNLPMSTITLIEDLLMVAMSAVMIAYHIL
jgi:copper chaperone CopZ